MGPGSSTPDGGMISGICRCLGIIHHTRATWDTLQSVLLHLVLPCQHSHSEVTHRTSTLAGSPLHGEPCQVVSVGYHHCVLWAW